jgi:hypothetical protein
LIPTPAIETEGTRRYRIACVGNCQVRSIELLLRRALPSATVESLDFSVSASRDADHRTAFVQRVADFDFILAQENGLTETRHDELRRNTRARILRICNLFFRGLHPDLCYVGRFGGRKGYLHYNSVAVLDAFARGLTPEQCLASVAGDAFARLGLDAAWEESLAALAARDARTDLPGASLVEAYTRKFQTFFVFNHPALPLVAEYVRRLLRLIGVAGADPGFLPHEDPLSFLMSPVHDSTAAARGLGFRTSQVIKDIAGDQERSRVHHR